ncbi:N-acetylglutamate kinase [Alkalispirochaeta americana]|uniref:Acetylglutamate kinase n=1 Tax=Alkalispirochaeta americana TaxID=159291 RepID=A0A1N6V9N8_9SPIO|nr:acetylglutamate kinase [Alkalispirochaeta americana]SIQ74601.1 N-acetylglutamate kinase [Alkalispirochaeta americana]
MELIVKVGGSVAADQQAMASLFQDLASLRIPSVLVHGGGKAVTDLAARLGITSSFHEGVRVTQPREMALVDMVLAGETNTELVRLAQRAGVAAVGLTGADGALLTGTLLFPGEGRTARVSSVNLAVPELLLKEGFLPVIATVGTGEDGLAVNINADEAAQAIACAAARRARKGSPPVHLCFISDTVGVLNDQGRIIPEITTSAIEELIAAGTVKDGMAAKIRSCRSALEAGVARVVIGDYSEAGDITRLLQGTKGTSLVPSSRGSTASERSSP